MKNLIKKIFGKLFLRKIKLPEVNCKVYIINDKSELLHESLGITEERILELKNLVIEKYPLNNIIDYKTSEIYEYLGQICKHPNELVCMVAMYDTAMFKYVTLTSFNKSII